MAKKKPSVRTFVKRDPAVWERILAVALEHPDFGPRRLGRVLKTEGIGVSESAIRSALRKEGLHTCKLRQEVLKRRRLSQTPRLAEEQNEAIEKSHARLGEHDPEEPAAVFLPAEPQTVADPDSVTPIAPPAPPPMGKALETLPVKPEPPGKRRPEWKAGRDRWIFRAVNAVLICVSIYAGTEIALRIWEIVHPGLDSPTAAAVRPPPEFRPAQRSAASTHPIEAYRVIWERNLFNVSDPLKKAGSHEGVDVEKIAVAEKELGLELIGTVVANDPKLNYAAIAVAATRSQAVFRERDRVGGVLIKGISRNNVVIETEKGQIKRLTVDTIDAENARRTKVLPGTSTGARAPTVGPGQLRVASTHSETDGSFLFENQDGPGELGVDLPSQLSETEEDHHGQTGISGYPRPQRLPPLRSE